MSKDSTPSGVALLEEARASEAHRWSLRLIGRLEGEDDAGDDMSDHELLVAHAEVFGGLGPV